MFRMVEISHLTSKIQDVFRITSEVVGHNGQTFCCLSSAVFEARNLSRQDLKLIVAPDPNQLECTEGGVAVGGGLAGGKISLNFGKKFRPRDDRIPKLDLLPTVDKEIWKSFKITTKRVYLTVLRRDDDTLVGEEDIPIDRGDRVEFREA